MSFKFKVILGTGGGSGNGFGIFKGNVTASRSSLYFNTARSQFGLTDSDNVSSGGTRQFSPAIPKGKPVQVELTNTVGTGIVANIDGATTAPINVLGDFIIAYF